MRHDAEEVDLGPVGDLHRFPRLPEVGDILQGLRFASLQFPGHDEQAIDDIGQQHAARHRDSHERGPQPPEQVRAGLHRRPDQPRQDLLRRSCERNARHRGRRRVRAEIHLLEFDRRTDLGCETRVDATDRDVPGFAARRLFGLPRVGNHRHDADDGHAVVQPDRGHDLNLGKRLVGVFQPLARVGHGLAQLGQQGGDDRCPRVICGGGADLSADRCEVGPVRLVEHVTLVMAEIFLHPGAKVRVHPLHVARLCVDDRVIPDRGAALLFRKGLYRGGKAAFRDALLALDHLAVDEVDRVVTHEDQHQEAGAEGNEQRTGNLERQSGSAYRHVEILSRTLISVSRFD